MVEKNILVACNTLDYILIQKVLSDHFLLDRAENGENIIEMRKAKAYDLLLIDIAFVRSDMKTISEVVGEHVPVIALSSEPNDARDKLIQEVGCSACYIKPIRKDLFCNFVTYWIDEFQKN